MLAYHNDCNADATIAVIEVPLKEASRFGIMNTQDDGRIYEFEEKPEHPKSTLASMGIYIFNWKLLRKLLIADAKDPDSNHDFGKDIIPQLLRMTSVCSLTNSKDTGKTLELSTPFGRQTWICSTQTMSSI